MSISESYSAVSACQSFPRLTIPQINRSNILDMMETVLRDNELIAVEGMEGIGKTTVLAQFALKYPNNSLCLFINSASRFAYDSSFLRFDLCNQLNCLLHREELTSSQQAEDALLGTLYRDLHGTSRRRRETFYFIVDGLPDIPKEESSGREILDLLPLGLEGFRFILSGNLDQVFSNRMPKISTKPLLLPGFTLDETARYLEDLGLAQDAITEIHNTCKGIPSHLTSIRRLLTSGSTIDDLLDNPKKMSLLSIEWKKVSQLNEEQLMILAVLAHDRKRHILADLSRLLSIDAEVIIDTVEKLGFIAVDPDTCEISYVSEAFRKFAADQLVNLSGQVTEVLISDLLKNPESDEALAYLPDELQKAGRFNDLVNYLSPDYFTRMIEHSQSLYPVKQKADLGAKTGLNLHRDGDLLRFSLQKAAILGLERSKVWRSEIEALMSLGDYESAIALAQSTVLKVDRLHLLAVIARFKSVQTGDQESQLQTQIHQLCEQIDFTTLGPRAINIAAELIYSDYDLALDIAEKGSKASREGDPLSLELAKISFSANLASSMVNDEDASSDDPMKALSSRVNDQGIVNYSRYASLALGKYGAAEIIAQAESLETPEERLNLLRLWATFNQERADAIEIADYAINILLQDLDYPSGLDTLLGFVQLLPSLANQDRLSALIRKLDKHKQTLKKLGSFEEHLKLQLAIIKAESKYNAESASRRIAELISSVEEIKDVSVKGKCLALVLVEFKDMDPVMGSESEEMRLASIRGGLDSCIETILENSSDQYKSTLGIIKVLTGLDANKALQLAMDLNTEDSRDRALIAFINAAVKAPLSTINMDPLIRAIDQISNQTLKSDGMLYLVTSLYKGLQVKTSRIPWVPDLTYVPAFMMPEEIESLAANISPFDPFTERPPEAIESNQLERIISESFALFEKVEQMKDNEKRCRARCLAYNLLTHLGEDKYLSSRSQLLRLLTEDWKKIDVAYKKINIGFNIVQMLAVSSPEMAHAFLDLIEIFRDEIVLDTSASGEMYLYLLNLASRAYSGLLEKNLDTPEDLQRIAEFIERVPSYGERAKLWGDLALRCYAKGSQEKCKHIVDKNVWPCFRRVERRDEEYCFQVLIKISPALFCAHQRTALEEIAELPSHHRDKAYEAICDFILSRIPPSDCLKSIISTEPEVTFNDLVDICELLHLIEEDAIIFGLVNTITYIVNTKRFRQRTSTQQISDIATRLRKVAESLPRPRFIKHDGYKIGVLSHISLLEQSKTTDWQNLINQAEKIANISDRAFVLSDIAAVLPGKEEKRRKQVLTETLKLIPQIPATLDIVTRYNILATRMATKDRTLAKECLKLALLAASEVETPELFLAQQESIELAYNIDPKFAESLISIIGEKANTSAALHKLQSQYKLLDLRRKKSDEMKSGDELDSTESDVMKDAMSFYTGLQGTEVGALSLERTRKLIQKAGSLPFAVSYFMFSWMVENAVVRFSHTDQAKTQIRPMFEAILISTEFAGKLVVRSSTQLKRARLYATKSQHSSGLVFRAGDRQRALRFLKKWFESEVKDYLKICDQYFGPEDLDILKILLSASQDCKVQILTSRMRQMRGNVPLPWEDSYRGHWRMNISNQAPPDTDIVVVGTDPLGRSPIHDRWWLTNGAGIMLGTSFNSLGITQDSIITVLSAEEAASCEETLNQYLYRLKREYNGEKLLYNVFTL